MLWCSFLFSSFVAGFDQLFVVEVQYWYALVREWIAVLLHWVDLGEPLLAPQFVSLVTEN